MDRIGVHVVVAHVVAAGQRHQAAEAAARAEALAHLEARLPELRAAVIQAARKEADRGR